MCGAKVQTQHDVLPVLQAQAKAKIQQSKTASATTKNFKNAVTLSIKQSVTLSIKQAAANAAPASGATTSLLKAGRRRESATNLINSSEGNKGAGTASVTAPAVLTSPSVALEAKQQMDRIEKSVAQLSVELSSMRAQMAQLLRRDGEPAAQTGAAMASL